MKSGVAALDGKLYVVGGCLQTLESCYRTEVFDPITRWKKSSTGSYDQCCGAGPFLTGSGFFFTGSGSSSYNRRLSIVKLIF